MNTTVDSLDSHAAPSRAADELNYLGDPCNKKPQHCSIWISWWRRPKKGFALQPRKKLFLYQCLRSYAVLFIALAREWAIYLSICHNIVYRKTPHLFLRFWEPLLSDCRYSVKSDRWEKCSMEEKNSTFVSHHNKDG